MPEPLDALKEAYEVLNREFDRVKAGEFDLMLRFFDPECEIHAIEGWPVSVYYGHEGYRRFFTDTFGEFEDVRVDVHEYIPGAGNVIVVLTTSSGFSIPVQTRLEVQATIIHEMRGPLILRQRNYADRRAGLAAAGLPDPLENQD